MERLLTEHLYKNNSEQEDDAFSSPIRNFTILELEKLAKINEKKAKCCVETHRFWDSNSNPVDFPVPCDNRSCTTCSEHRLYKYRKEHKLQIDTLAKSIKNPKAFVWTGWVKPIEEFTREFCKSKLLKVFRLCKQFSRTEFSIHMEVKIKEDNPHYAYLHFHVVSGYIHKLRLVEALYGRYIKYEKALKYESLSYYVSKYASKVPMFFSNLQENKYTLLVYKLQMNRFSPKTELCVVNNLYAKIKEIEKNKFIVDNVKEIWINNLKKNNKKTVKGEKPPPKYYLEANIEREVYNAFRRDADTVYHPFLDSYETSHCKKSKVVTLEDFIDG